MINNNVEGQGMPPNAGYTPNQNVQVNLPPQKQKKKKKHRFLKFLLFNALLIGLYKGTDYICDKIAYNEISKVAGDYPFSFDAETDNIGYVTGNFAVPTVYVDDEGKELVVEWTSNNENIVNFNGGMATVNRPAGAGRTVMVKQTYKKFIGEAEEEFTLYVVPTGTVAVENVDVVTVEELQNEEYNRDMQAVINANGELEYMMGEFKNTYVYSAEDALTMLEAYRSEFGAPAEVEFKFDRVMTTSLNKAYIFGVYVNGYRISDASADVVVEADSCQMKKISMDTDLRNYEAVEENAELDHEQIIKDYVVVNDPDNSRYEIILLPGETIVYEGKTVRTYVVVYANGAIYEIYIDVSTGDVIKYFTEDTDGNKEINHKGETVECSATDDFGVDFTFDALYEKLPGELWEGYLLHDLGRGIHAYNNEGYWELYNYALSQVDAGGEIPVSDWGWALLAIELQEINHNLSYSISSDTNVFEQGSEAKAYYNLQRAYDWYKNMYGRISYDGNGAPITVLMNVEEKTDNASWTSSLKLFKVNPPKKLKYTLGNNTDVLAHEYTHAVFGSIGAFDTNANSELCGINEAYADVFGCLITGSSDWKVGVTYYADGTPVCVRDVANINDGTGVKPIAPGSAKYKDEYWDNEEHTISTVISHVGYEMWASEYFGSRDVADIWYNSMSYCYNNDSTFLTCRKYIIQAAQDLGYSTEQVDFIAYQFDQVEVFDESYVITTEKFLTDTEENTDGTTTIKTKSSAVEGDYILDDTIVRKYIIAYSPANIILGDGTCYYIFEANNDYSEEVEAAISAKLTESFNNQYPDMNLLGNQVTITYKQIPKLAMPILQSFCADSSDYIRNVTFDTLGMEESELDDSTASIFDFLFWFAFDFRVVESTAYDFYDGFGLIE